MGGEVGIFLNPINSVFIFLDKALSSSWQYGLSPFKGGSVPMRETIGLFMSMDTFCQIRM